MRTWVVVLAICTPVTVFGQPDPAPAELAEPAAPPTAAAEGTAPLIPEAPRTDVLPPEPSKYPNGLRLMASDLTIFRLNPLGLETRARIGVQKKLFPSDMKLTEN